MKSYQVIETHSIKTNNRRYYVDGVRVSKEKLDFLKFGRMKESVMTHVTPTHFRHFYIVRA